MREKAKWAGSFYSIFGKTMSKIGKQPIVIPEGVSVRKDGGYLIVQGPKGALKIQILPYISVSIQEKEITFKPDIETKQSRSNWGTLRSLTQGAVIGVVDGYEKQLDIEGVGYRALMEGRDLVLHLGYSHPVKVKAPEFINIGVDKNTIKVSGIDKNLVGQVAADIRALKKPEPYKGKGIRYKGEVIRRKAGKKVAGTTGSK